MSWKQRCLKIWRKLSEKEFHPAVPYFQWSEIFSLFYAKYIKSFKSVFSLLFFVPLTKWLERLSRQKILSNCFGHSVKSRRKNENTLGDFASFKKLGLKSKLILNWVEINNYLRCSRKQNNNHTWRLSKVWGVKVWVLHYD